MASKFYNEIKNARIEKEVEAVYKKGINTYFTQSSIQHPFGCDGYIEQKIKYKDIEDETIIPKGIETRVDYEDIGKFLRLITEFKFDENFSSKAHKSKVLIQVLYYLKSFELEGKPLPNVILVGDKDETFVMHSNDISNYLDENIDWDIAPSIAPSKNSELLMKMLKDKKINPFVFPIDEHFSFKAVADKISYLALNIQRKVRVTEHNISVIYDYFVNKVVKNSSKIDANRLVYIFIELMINPNENYKHPTKKNTLVVSDGELVQINGDSYDSFFSYFERNYKPKEKEKFTEIADRLIEDTNRRFKGEFYTPTLWVDEAHRMISNQFGENWKQEYVVWDCAWGTGNLTRDYRFNELYCSTLNESDIEIGKKYNSRGSTKFQYDFLNDDIDILQGKELLENDYCKLPRELLNSLKMNKPIIFLINPPYGTANNAGTKEGDHKQGIALTKVNELMKEANMGASSQQLYAQFLYRIILMKKIFNLTNVNICIYAKSTYMTGSTFKKLRDSFLSNFKYETGMLFQASHFADVKGVWGIDFSIWSSGETLDKNKFIHELKDLNESNNIVTTEKKIIYNIDKQKTCSDWIKEEIKSLKTVDAPQLGSALIVKSKGVGNLVEKSLGYYVNVGNSVYKNTTDVFLVSSTSSMGHGISILPINFKKVVSNFSARKLIIGKYANWINDKDEYLIPNINHPNYEEWNNDAIIHSLFNSSSAQSSLRDIEYKDKTWDIKNEFFFMSVSDIEELADEFENDEIYEDIKAFGDERYVYKLLQEIELSKEAQAVLDKAIELTKKSFGYRELFNEEKSEYHINTWDAGWYQIKGLLNHYLKDDYKEFVKLYKELEEKMRPMVYELGFLI